MLTDASILIGRQKYPVADRPKEVDRSAYLGGAVLFAFISAVLFLLGTRQGIGILPDSTRYMRLGPEPYDAPMYTWFLDAFVMSGIEATTGAKILGLALVCINSATIWYLLLRGTNSRFYAAAGTALIVFSPHFVSGHAVAMSEPLFIFFLFCSLLALIGALHSKSRMWTASAGVVFALALLVRFTAAPFGAAMAACLLLNPVKTIRQRIIDTAIFGMSAGGVFFGWAAASELMTGQATGRAFSFHGNADAERWMSGLETLAALLMPLQVPTLLRVAVLLLVIVGGAWLWVRHARQVLSRASAGQGTAKDMIAICLGLFFPLYLVFMILAVSIEANLPLNGRYALPLYVTTVIAITIVIAKSPPSSGAINYVFQAFAVLAVLVLTSHMIRTADRTREAFVDGIGYRSIAWMTSPTIHALKALPANAVIFSNAPDPINYLTDRKSLFIPFLFQRRTGIDNPGYPYERQLQDMAHQLAKGNSFIVFLDGVDWRFFLVAEADLKRRLRLTLIEDTPDGRIYAMQGSNPQDGNTSN